MAEYALVGTDNIVKAVIVADSAFITDNGSSIRTQYGASDGTWVDAGATKVGPGWTYDSNTGEFAPPSLEA